MHQLLPVGNLQDAAVPLADFDVGHTALHILWQVAFYYPHAFAVWPRLIRLFAQNLLSVDGQPHGFGYPDSGSRVGYETTRWHIARR